ncbi:MAG: GNAT family N-acetyltransferase [Bacilli bacterium]|jgi:putative hemolysin
MSQFKGFISSNFEIKLADQESEFLEIYKLRYEELLLCYNKGNANETGLFIDEYDRVCDHLIAVDLSNNTIAGTYRLVRKEHIKEIGMFTTEHEFDISKIKDYEILELGRAVVRNEYRNGGVIALLWRGIVKYVATYGIRFMFGTASFFGIDPTPYRHALSKIYHNHLSPLEFRAVAINHPVRLNYFTPEEIDSKLARKEIPPLVKGYINLGATFGEGGFLDYDFNSLDVFTLIDMNTVNQRYLERFLK